MENVFLYLLKPYLAYIDKGSFFRKPFGAVYILLAVVNLLFPFYLLYLALDNRFFSYADGTIIFVFMINWVFILIGGLVSFQVWWIRSAAVINVTEDEAEFIAIPVLAHFIQTIGEWIGTWVGVVGFLVALLARITLERGGSAILEFLEFGFLSRGYLGIALLPVIGFLIIVAARFVAEQCRVFAAIANNTNKSARQGQG